MSQTDLRPAHVEIKNENTGKIIAGVVLAVAIIAAGTWSYQAGMWKGKPTAHYAVSDSQLPAPSLPVAPKHG